MVRLLILLMLLLPCSAWAMDVQLEWDASPDVSVTGYRIYYWSYLGLNSVDAGNLLTHRINGLPATRHAFAAVAYNAEGAESVYSNVINVSPAEYAAVKLGSTKGTIKVGGRKVRIR